MRPESDPRSRVATVMSAGVAIVSLVLGILFLALLMAGCSASTPTAPSSTAAPTTATSGNSSSGSTASSPPANLPVAGSAAVSPAAAVAAAVGPSVVNVRVSGVTASPNFGNEPYQGIGSGVIYSSDGYIITCEHVVSANGTPAQTVEVTFSSGEQVPATIVATDSFTDIAVIKVTKTGLPATTFGRLSDIQVGEYAIAIGSPASYSNSVTLGIISGLDRTIESTGSTS